MSKTIVVTGTSSGFGKLIAQTEAKKGNTVFATMRNVNGKNAEAAASLTNWANENGYKINVVELDVTDDTSVSNAVSEVLSKTDKVDVLINNAGLFITGMGEASTPADYQKVFEVNVYGVVRVTNAFLPQLRKQGSGLIVTVSSVMGRIVLPFTPVYTASKWAVEAIAENYRYELSQLGIDSVIVQPGAFPTEIFGKTLQASNQGVVAESGVVGQTFEAVMGSFGQMFSGEFVPDPQDVADKTSELIDLPVGERPLRSVVDPLMGGDGATQLNGLTDQVQAATLGGMQLGHLQQVNPEAVS